MAITPGVQNSSAEQMWLIVSTVSLGQLRASVQNKQTWQYRKVVPLTVKDLHVLLSCEVGRQGHGRSVSRSVRRH